MRKQIALILAVAVMLCMPVRAAAESTTITTVVPEPAYQMTIPADIQMEYRAGSCTIGVPVHCSVLRFRRKSLSDGCRIPQWCIFQSNHVHHDSLCLLRQNGRRPMRMGFGGQADLQPDGRWQRDPLRTYGRRQNPIGF